MPPPPAEPLASRIFLGPALRTQPDRRLVKLVREGYEGAFEEIVRRYRKPLDRFAAAIVGNRSEDVTQDAFSKALLALRGTEAEIELRPWLYRIVRNTALNVLRDAPPATEELGEIVVGGPSAAVEAERREEITELMERLRALPEPQRAAIVMRELEGLSHEEIAAALGVTGGAARQAIYRARMALRNGLGLLVPLPLLRVLFDHGAEAAAAGGAAAAAGAATATTGGGAATLGGLSGGAALKAGVATALVAGSVGAGVVVEQNRDERAPEPAAASATQGPGGGETAQSGGSSGSSGRGTSGGSGEGRDDSSGQGRGRGRGGDDDSSGQGRSDDDDSSGSSGRSGSDDDDGDDRSGGSNSGPGSGDEDDGDDAESHRGSGSSGSGSGSSESGSTTLSPPFESDDDDDDASGLHSGSSGSSDDPASDDED
jgi:RNA polymerase sigma factor (sigma-70 family)